MLAPISWLKDFVDIKLPLKDLCWRLTEVGLSVERIIKNSEDTILELEITPNRPDCLSILGIAREIAAIENKSIKYQISSIKYKKTVKDLNIKIINNYELCPRYTGIIISGVTIKPSPPLIQERLKKINLRLINNIVDLSNYVMWELGNPIHCFDYDKITDKTMYLQKSVGGEDFTSVDEISYKLPSNAIIIKDKNRVIDLCGLKGGLNTGISNTTKNIFIHVPVYDPVLIRRTSQALGLRSDASAIFERGVNRGGTIDALLRLAELILKYAGGKISSGIIDFKKEEFLPWKLKLSLQRSEKILGLKIPEKRVLEILELLNLSPKKDSDEIIEVTVPTYRQDLKIEEDLIEEVARHYGYNKFSLTLPSGQIPTQKVAYFKDYRFEEKVKNLMAASGFSEVYTYGLISKAQLQKLDSGLLEKAIKIVNPVSLDYEYLRPTIIGNLLEAIKLNQPNFEKIRLFELGKTYKRIKNYESRNMSYVERNYLVAVSTGEKYYELKGVVETLLSRLNVKNVNFNSLDEAKVKEFSLEHPYRTALIELRVRNQESRILGIVGEISPEILERFSIKGRVTLIDLDYSLLEELASGVKQFKPIPPYPAIIEDLTFVFPENILVSEVIAEIKKITPLISNIEFIDAFKDARTFRIYYQSKERNLTEKEVKELREKILEKLKTKFNLKLKVKE